MNPAGAFSADNTKRNIGKNRGEKEEFFDKKSRPLRPGVLSSPSHGSSPTIQQQDGNFVCFRESLKHNEPYHKTDEKSSENREIFKKTSTYFRYQKQYRICLISWAKAHKIREAGGLSLKFGPVSLLRRAFTCTTADTAMAKTPMCTRNDGIIPKIIKYCQVKKGKKRCLQESWKR